MASESNKRIAKNTIYLYLRMIVTMIVTLYTARLILATLGEDDYGLYNVIGGIVVLFSFLNTAMSNATQRFLSYEIGINNQKQLQRTFSMSVTCHIFLAIIVLIIAETVGLWFVSTQMNIPIDRHKAAIWVYHFSVATFIINILRVPYNASVISHEKMSFYAYLSIIDVFLNLGIVFLFIFSSFDKLIFYAVLKLAITFLCWLANYIYCIKKLKCCTYDLFWDNLLFKKLLGFSGWSMLSGGSVLVSQSGSNILINIFNGVAVNAAYGIANQVSSAIYGFVSNFQMAFQPQIVKLYAEREIKAQTILINRAALLSYFLLLIIGVPFMINADVVLNLWLVDVPHYATEFCQWMIVYSLIDAIQAPIWMAINATGKIKIYSIWSSSIILLNLPIAWLLLYLELSPVYVFIVRVLINMIVALIRVAYVKQFIQFPALEYFLLVIKRAAPVTILSFGLSYTIHNFMLEGISGLLIESIFSFIITSILIMYFGFNKSERQYVISLVHSKLKK